MDPDVRRHRFLDNIPGFKRWTADLTRGSQLPRLDNLPDDVLILIFSQCRIDDIFALRGTCSILRNIWLDYSVHIIPSVARCTFPTSTLLLEPPTAPDGYSFTWLKGRIPLQLAAILLDRHRFIYEGQRWPPSARIGAPAEDALALEFRGRVANGWRLLGRLFYISKVIYELDAKDILSMSNKKATWLTAHRPHYEVEMAQLREELVLQRRLQFIQSMVYSEAQDYILLFMLLSGAWKIRQNDRRDETGGVASKNDPIWLFDPEYGADAPRSVRKGESWVTWFILHQGPKLFWEQWWSLPSEAPETMNHVRDRAIEAFFSPLRPADSAIHGRDDVSDPHKELHKIQRSSAEKVQQAMDEKCGGSARTLHYYYHHKYTEDRHTQAGAGRNPELYGVPETMGSVPFHMNFSAYEPGKGGTYLQ